MNKWSDLSKKLNEAISNNGGHTKMSSGEINIWFKQDGKVGAEMNCYDIGDWPRHLYFGLFDSEELAYEAISNKIDEAIKVLKYKG